MTGGEKLEVSLAHRLLRHLPAAAELYNMYGPAECTVEATVQRVTLADTVVPIGRALAVQQLHIGAPEGVVGELWIGGPCVMDGYLNAPNPCAEGWYPTGDLCYRLGAVYHYVGRRDFQVKLRGQRIELGEIEGVLGHQAVVLKDPQRERLVAFVVLPTSGGTPGTPGEAELQGELRLQCEAKLPAFMVPAKIVCLEQMPLSADQGDIGISYSLLL